jgi:hypothetical protein
MDQMVAAAAAADAQQKAFQQTFADAFAMLGSLPLPWARLLSVLSLLALLGTVWLSRRLGRLGAELQQLRESHEHDGGDRALISQLLQLSAESKELRRRRVMTRMLSHMQHRALGGTFSRGR